MIAVENLSKAKGGAQVARAKTVRAQMINSATKGAVGETVKNATQNSVGDKIKSFFRFKKNNSHYERQVNGIWRNWADGFWSLFYSN
ncbi:hypothetical protein [Flavobacterium mesophilum]|uniref:hypothetical protein n=1 Tax=Flavobacterium mesophilum TaxID=3143495 RepID=UPI0031D36C98